MKQRYRVIALLLLITILLYLPALAQTTTSVTGTVKDVTGTPVISGKISFQLMPGPDATISGAARYTLTQTNCAINQPQIATISRTSNVVTATLTSTPSQPFSIGDVVNVTGVTDSSFNSSGFTLTNVTGAGLTLTWSQTASNGSSSGGFVGGVLGKNGTGVCTLVTNTAVSPPGSYYIATVYASGVKTSQFNFPTYLASQDISTTVPTPATAPFQSFVDVISNQTIGGDKDFLGNITFGGGTSFTAVSKLNNIIFVDGVKYPATQVGIQSAFTDACATTGGSLNGTVVYLPIGVVSLSNTSGQQFTITCPLKVIGPGPSLLWFVVSNTVPNSVVGFRVKPSASYEGWFPFEGFRFVGNGKVGGTAFFLDSTTAGVNHFILDNVEIDSLDPAAWCVDMTAGAANQFFYGKITNNHLGCGIRLNSSSSDDSWLIQHNNWGSAATDTLPCVDATTQAGASHITLFNNNGGCNGGFFISHGTTEPKILYNQIEQPLFTSTEANSALIDLIGDTYAIDGAEIVGNNMGSNNFVTTLIRVGAATHTSILGRNVLGIKATTGVGILLTASSSGTYIDANNTEFIGVGGGAVAMTNASGSNPFCSLYPTSTGTLAATICNDTIGGILVTPNSGAGFSWQFSPTGPLQGGKGDTILLQGAGAGNSQILVPNNAGGNFLDLDINSGPVAKAQVASDFTLAGNTSLQTIGALTFTTQANTENLSFYCSIDYSQATAAVADAFGIQVATNAPTNVRAAGIVYTSASASTTGILSTLSTTTATNIATFTPSATATVFTATLSGTIELPASAHTINIMASQSNAGDLLTIKRGSYCQLL